MSSTPILQHIRRHDVAQFREAARKFRVHILVRRTNPASLQYVGRKGYLPKPIDCKPKTADCDVVLPSGLISRCAGLVVNPAISGFDKAFKSTQKRDDAIAIWKKFKLRHGLGSESLTPGKTYLEGSSLEKVGSQHYFTLNRGGVYLVQDDPRHMHFGCLYFCPFQLQGAFLADARSALKSFSERGMLSYLYGDYDLYGIVPVDMPEFKTVEQSIIFGTKNLYSEKSREIADFLNRSIGAQMIQHGAQENDPSQSGHADESIDVFWANGDVSEARGRAEIEKLYRVDFHERKTGAGSSGLVRP